MEAAVAEPVAVGQPLVAAFVAAGADPALDIGLHQQLQHRFGGRSQEILATALRQQLGQWHALLGHRVLSVRVEVAQLHLSRPIPVTTQIKTKFPPRARTLTGGSAARGPMKKTSKANRGGKSGEKSQRQPPPPPPTNGPPKELYRLRKVTEWVLGILTASGFLLAVLTFLPRPTLDVGPPSDPLDPLTAPVTIGNASLLPLENIQIGIGVCTLAATHNGKRFILRDPAARPDCYGSLDTIFTYSKWRGWEGHTLTADEKEMVLMSDLLSIFQIQSITSANVAIRVSFGPWFLPITREKPFHLLTRKLDNGSYIWVQSPNN